MPKGVIIVEYSPDKAAKAKTLSQAFQRKGYSVLYKIVENKGTLAFYFEGVVYEEGDYSYLVARASRLSK